MEGSTWALQLLPCVCWGLPDRNRTEPLRTIMRLCGCLLALFLGLGSAAVFAQATPPMPLSPDVVAAAIAAAKAPAPPTAYVLKGVSKPVTRNAPLDPEVAKTLDPNKILTFGAVYTPFIRAALLARQATDAGRAFGPADISAAVQDSLTYVAALPWERTDVTGPDRLVDTVYVIVTPPGSTDRAQIVQPVWVKTDTSQLRKILGPSVPERAMLAAFAPDAIQAGREFVIVYAGTVYAQRVEIRPEDISAWR